jgi:hypothetical protein
MITHWLSVSFVQSIFCYYEIYMYKLQIQMNTFIINRIYFKFIIYIPNLSSYYFYILHNFGSWIAWGTYKIQLSWNPSSRNQLNFWHFFNKKKPTDILFRVNLLAWSNLGSYNLSRRNWVSPGCLGQGYYCQRQQVPPNHLKVFRLIQNKMDPKILNS